MFDAEEFEISDEITLRKTQFIRPDIKLPGVVDYPVRLAEHEFIGIDGEKHIYAHGSVLTEAGVMGVYCDKYITTIDFINPRTNMLYRANFDRWLSDNEIKQAATKIVNNLVYKLPNEI